MTTETPVTQAPEPVAAAETAAPKATPALNPLSRWDLTTNFMKFLDPHLSLPLLVFVSDKKARKRGKRATFFKNLLKNKQKNKNHSFIPHRSFSADDTTFCARPN